MNDLGEALRGLAGTAQAPSPADPAELWVQGRARVRRRRAMAVVLVGVILGALSGLGTFVAVPTSAVVPASTRHEPALPRNIWSAPEWIPSTGEAGPLGTVAALARYGTYPSEGRFLVSATTGEYRRLELPDYLDFDTEVQMQLAPDGNHIGYFFRTDPRPSPDDDNSPDGFALYDTRTGEVRRWKVPLPVGTSYSAYGGQSMLWLDASHIVFYGSLVGSNGRTSGTASYVWDLDRAAPTELRSGGTPGIGNVGPPNLDGQVLGMVDPTAGGKYGFLDPTARHDVGSVIRLPVDQVEIGFVRVTRQGSLVIASDSWGSSHAVFTGSVDAQGRVRKVAPLDSLQGKFVMGWIARDQVLALGAVGTPEGRPALFRVGLHDGSQVRLGSAPAAGDGGYVDTNTLGTPLLQLATDLLSVPMVDGVHPPSMDPRVRLAAIVAGAAAGAGLLAAVGIMLRRRPRA